MSKPNWNRLVIHCEEKRPRFINGQEIPNWQQGPSFLEVVNILARKGWVLFSDTSALWHDHGKLTFIRPKQYLRIRCEEKRPRYINGREIPNWQQGPTVWEAMIFLARKGWMPFFDTSAVLLGYGELTLIRPEQ